MRVEKQRVFCAGRVEFAIDHRRSAGDSQFLRVKSALLQHLADRVGIAHDVGRIAGDVRQRKQLRKAAHDLGFMLLAIFADGIANGLWRAFLSSDLLARQASCA